jgi:hypothetical protein
MYGSQNPHANQNNATKNEIVFQNLIAVANNPVLMGALSEEAQKKLIATIAVYTEENLKAIEYYRESNLGQNHKWEEPEHHSKR